MRRRTQHKGYNDTKYEMKSNYENVQMLDIFEIMVVE